MEYQDLKSGIRIHLNSAAEDFFMVGYFLRQISENALFAEDGYKSIWEFAKGEYSLSISSASRFMAINARFSIDGGEHMAEQYAGMGVSKLQEMLGLPDEELEKVTKETTVREIRALKKKLGEPKSFFGLPKTVRPEGSLLTTPGCGDGKHDCFSCARPCGIRQEERYCRADTMGNPFPCTQMGEEKRLEIGAGISSGQCQILNPELAPIREGDKEPDPCCLTCGHSACLPRCDVAKKRDGGGKEKELAELEGWQEEAEAKKPDMTQMEIEKLYEWLGIRTGDTITAASLKDTHGRAYRGNNDFTCSPKGVRTGRSKEMTWAQAAKALTEAQARKKELEKPTGPQVFQEPGIIDADFREAGGEPGENPGKMAGEAQEPGEQGERGPEEYEILDIKLLLDKVGQDLKAYKEAECPPNMIQKQRIMVDALTLLIKQLEEGGAEL